MTSNRKRWLIGLLVVVLGAGGYFAWQTLGGDNLPSGYCFWCQDFKSGVHVLTLPKDSAFQQASLVPKGGNKNAAATASPPAGPT